MWAHYATKYHGAGIGGVSIELKVVPLVRPEDKAYCRPTVRSLNASSR
jgi:hypothetical protein